MKNQHTRFTILIGSLLVFLSLNLFGQREMEYLNRGVVAVRTSSSQVFVSWRMLGTEYGQNASYNLYRGSTLIASNLDVTNYVDNTSTTGTYSVSAVIGGSEQSKSTAANVWSDFYTTVSISPPSSNHHANDASVGDLDNDGDYEFVLKWEANDSKDNSQSGVTDVVYLDGIEMDGTPKWRINLGINIRAGAHYTQFMVYDLDGDGIAEVACKTAPGTRDGTGKYLSKGPAANDNDGADYRNSSGYILSGPEYLTIFNGETGAEMATTNYIPARGNVSDWGDSYGNRVDRFLACIAYLDGKRPSLVMCRGYYTRTVLAAWDWRNGSLGHRWTFDTDNGYSSYAGQGNHNLSVADVDNDGRDEIIYGAMAVNDNGSGLWSSGLGHGDAMHVSDIDPNRPGLEKWGIHEGSSTPRSALLDARTGAVIWKTGNADAGRGVSADLSASHAGMECWGGTDGLRSATNSYVGNTPSYGNFVIWWDGDLSRELCDADRIDKWVNGSTNRLVTIYNYENSSTNNSTKKNPCLQADILGDWREELITRSSDNTKLIIFTTTNTTNTRMYTLMHDPVYRLGIAWQNVGYNQPPHTGFFLGNGMSSPPVPDITLIGGSSGGSTSIWLEAECGNVGSLWNTLSDDDASNDQYVTIQPGNNSTGSAPGSSSGQISYDINVSESGNYVLWARVITPNGEDDSFWVKIDDGSWYEWNEIGPNSDWAWEQCNSYNLSTGSHTLTIAYREDGAKLDKILITNTGDSPSGEGSAANNCGTTPGNIIVRAKGKNGEEQIQLDVDGSTIATWTLTTSYQDYTATGSGTSRVYFINDQGSIRDAEVDYIIVDGTTYQSEDQPTNTAVWDGSSCGGSYSERLDCNGYIEYTVPESTPVPVTGVGVSPTTASVNVGATTQLTETIAPSDATNKNVTWSSSNSSIASVSSSGLVAGVAEGSATITVTTVDGGFTATCNVTVTTLVVPVSGVSISPTTASVNFGATTQLTATVSPSNATNKAVSWSSSNSSIASVSSIGLVTGEAEGSATITVTTDDGGYSATCNVTVTDDIPPTTISIQENETGVVSYDGIITSGFSGYTGDGSIDTDNATGNGITWQICVPSSGTYTLQWRYSNGDSKDRPGRLLVNGSVVEPNVSLPPTGGWTSWTMSTAVDVDLAAGTQTIRLEGTTSSALGLTDYITITGDNPLAGECAGTSYTLTTSTSGQGSVSGGGTYAEGTVVTVTATPDAGWQFDSWSGDASGSANPVSITMNANKSVTANFSQMPVNTYVLSTSVNGQGSVSGAGTYSEGTVVTVTAAPDAGWQFDSWSGDASGSANPVSVAMDGNKSVTANFSEATYPTSLTIQENETGFCSVDGSIDNNNAGFTGTGFANTDNANGNGITWSVNIPAAGSYSIVWRYANGGSTDRTAQLLEDGTTMVASVSMPSTGNWTSWTETSPVNVNLSAGIKLIRLQATTSSGLANIDYVTLSGEGLVAVACIGQKSAKVQSNLSDAETEPEIKYYPVPVEDVLNIQFGRELKESVEIYLYDITGNAVRFDKAYGSNHILDMSGLPEGLYMVKICGENLNTIERVVKN